MSIKPTVVRLAHVVQFLRVHLFFLPMVIIIFEVCARRRTRLGLAWMLAASFFFYGWWDRSFLVLLLVSLSFNYVVGLALGGVAGRERIGTALLVVSVSLNLLLLGFFKYRTFLAENFSYISGKDLVSFVNNSSARHLFLYIRANLLFS